MNQKNKKKFSLKARIHSFQYAWAGCLSFFKEEHNTRIHLFITALVIISGFFFSVSATEWLIIILCIALVFGAELINTSIERLCDFVHPEKHPLIKKVKDVSSAAVLIFAIASATCGLIIFIPRIIELLTPSII